MRLEIERTTPKGPSHMEVYEVPDRPGLTVLDAIFWVREHVDPTVAVRFSCRSANACKECLMSIDGTRAYACTTPAVGGMTVRPLPNKPVVRDLVTLLERRPPLT